MQGRTRPDQTNRECEQGTHDGRHNVGNLYSKRGLLKAGSLMQIGGKIIRDADYKYSGATGKKANPATRSVDQRTYVRFCMNLCTAPSTRCSNGCARSTVSCHTLAPLDRLVARVRMHDRYGNTSEKCLDKRTTSEL
jgi:hypothetical protein